MFREQVDQIQDWYKKIPAWQQEAVYRLFTGTKLDTLENDIYNICLSEYKVSDIPFSYNPPSLNLSAVQNTDKLEEHKLLSLSDVCGVAKLDTSNSLEFDETLSIIYGENGSGKSSYIRLLKKIFNCKGAIDLLSNVYSTEKVTPSAKLCMAHNYTGSIDKQEYDWSNNEAIEQLHSLIQIYDNEAANIYVTTANEIVFEPEVLATFTKLATLFDAINGKLSQHDLTVEAKTPEMPKEYMGTDIYTKTSSVSHTTDYKKFCENISWDEKKNAELEVLSASLKEDDPARQAVKMRKQSEYIRTIKNRIKGIHDGLNNEIVEKIFAAKTDYILKSKIAKDATEKAFSSLNLDGVGSETWKALWEQARKYSGEYAYPGSAFPNIDDNAVCVLCHQPLLSDAKNRFASFESYVTSGLENEKKKAFEEIEKHINALPNIDDVEYINNEMKANGLQDDEANSLAGYFLVLKARKDSICAAKDIQSITTNIDLDSANKYLDTLIEVTAQNATALEGAVSNYQAQKKAFDELSAAEWINKHPLFIQNKIITKKIEHAQKSCNTKAISILKSTLSEQLITEDYIKAFQEELNALKASHIKVGIEKRVSKGKTSHFIVLKGVQSPVDARKVLSEGEYRVVSLSAFLAESKMSSKITSFIFDDPISSLDIEFEERVVDRLVDLSNERQVIVFSHRLPFALLIQEKSKDACKVLTLEKDPLGYPSKGFPISDQKPKTAIEQIRREIARIKKLKENKDVANYKSGIKALCQDIRKVVEGGIERALLFEVVKRYNRNISSLKLRYLKEIKPDDVDVFEKMMTKYSFDEHSQPNETPRALPTLDEIETDVNSFAVKINELAGIVKRVDNQK